MSQSPERAADSERRRAVAYLDLWERQLADVAAQAPPATAATAARKGPKAGA